MDTRRHRLRGVCITLALTILAAPMAQAQLTDQAQTPNAEGAGILKSLEQQVGAGVGDLMTPGSSLFIIARDPARSVRRGRQLFQRKFTDAQGFGPRARVDSATQLRVHSRARASTSGSFGRSPTVTSTAPAFAASMLI